MTDKEAISVVGQEPYSTHFVTSKDGVNLGYWQIGHGPGLLMLHGAMESVHSHTQLAEALAGSFSVFLVDRRGRGLSGPYGRQYSVAEDVADVEALLAQTGARFLFGVSSGAIVALMAAISLPAVRKIALYEPPVALPRAEANGVLTRYDAEMAQGKLSAALVTGMLGGQMGPPVFKYLPRWLLEWLTTRMMASEDRKAKPGDVTFRKLAPTLHYDFSLAAEVSERLEPFRAVPCEALLLGGSQSPAYLKAGLDQLEKILPHARRVEFPGLNHNGSGNRAWGGQPERVAEELRRFFV